jgi:hypothetical protein
MTRLVCAWVLVNGVLLAPTWLSAAVRDTPAAAWISVEAALIAGGVALVPRLQWRRGLAWVAAVGVVLAGAVGFVDLVFQVSLGRSLNLSIDLYLLDAVRRLALGNMGALRTVLASGAVIVLGAAAMFAVAWCLTPPRGEDGADTARTRRMALGLIAVTMALAALGAGVNAVGQRVTVPAGAFALDQVRLAVQTRAERIAFRADLAAVPDGRLEVVEPLAELGGRNVVLAYLESYGVAALEDPELAAVVRPRLQAARGRLESTGVHMVTGRMTSPTLGGQSWYAHGTMLSGLWLENQLRYELMLASDRDNLLDDFARAGYRTATVMPAITTAWPEAVRIGFDDVYTSQNIPYEGPPFFWVTMPDQYTWSFVGDVLDRMDAPLFTEVGMVSSHAPWTPVLPLVDWDAMEGGTVFEPYRQEGYPPEEIWWDVEVLRDGYARSMAYSIDAMAEFAERRLDDRTLLIVSGDHQAAPWVTGAEGADVPVHVLSRDPSILEPFLEWGFSPGALPSPERPARRMDSFRMWFVGAYSEEASQPGP